MKQAAEERGVTHSLGGAHASHFPTFHHLLPVVSTKHSSLSVCSAKIHTTTEHLAETERTEKLLVCVGFSFSFPREKVGSRTLQEE